MNSHLSKMATLIIPLVLVAVNSCRGDGPWIDVHPIFKRIQRQVSKRENVLICKPSDSTGASRCALIYLDKKTRDSHCIAIFRNQQSREVPIEFRGSKLQLPDDFGRIVKRVFNAEPAAPVVDFSKQNDSAIKSLFDRLHTNLKTMGLATTGVVEFDTMTVIQRGIHKGRLARLLKWTRASIRVLKPIRNLEVDFLPPELLADQAHMHLAMLGVPAGTKSVLSLTYDVESRQSLVATTSALLIRSGKRSLEFAKQPEVKARLKRNSAQLTGDHIERGILALKPEDYRTLLAATVVNRRTAALVWYQHPRMYCLSRKVPKHGN